MNTSQLLTPGAMIRHAEQAQTAVTVETVGGRQYLGRILSYDGHGLLLGGDHTVTLIVLAQIASVTTARAIVEQPAIEAHAV